MTDDTIDTVSKALRRAWQLGQTYWQQADSDSYKQQDKSDETQKKFEALVDETRALLSASKPDTPSADMQDERGACEVELEKSSWTRQAEARNAFRDGWRAGRAFSDRAASTSANVAPAATVQLVRDACQIDNFTGRVCRYGTRSCVAEHVATVQSGDVIPHTKAGFVGAFYATHHCKPTEQEIFDAGVRAGRDIYAAPQSSQPVEAGEAKQFPTPISISADKICEIAGKYNLGNPRLDALRCFVNEIIIVNEAEYAKSE